MVNGSTFAAFGTFINGNFPALYECSNGCNPGTYVDIFAQVVGFDFGGGGAAINGYIYNPVDWGNFLAQGPSYFFISGSPVLIDAAGDFSGTFTFTGALCGTDDPYNGVCVADLPVLTGGGTVTLHVSYMPCCSPDSPLLQVDGVSYTLTPATTPEPGTLALLGPAMLGVAAILCRRLGLRLQ